LEKKSLLNNKLFDDQSINNQSICDQLLDNQSVDSQSLENESINDQSIDISLIPPTSLDYLIHLTDDTGIIQHTKYGIPNLKEGYCVDDNSRALLMAVMAYRQNKNQDTLKLISIYLSFIDYMHLENGDFRNFLSYSRQYLDKYGSEDSFGRTIWALGYLIRFSPNDLFKQMGKEMFINSVQHFISLKTIRGAANTIIGIYNYLKNTPNDEIMISEMSKLVKIIIEAYKKQAKEGWKWFEPDMTYDNAIIPLSLFSAYEIVPDSEVLKIAKESALFLESKTMRREHLTPIGNKGWFRHGGKIPENDQQAIEVVAMVLLYNKLFNITKKQIYRDKMYKCYLWFHGKNTLRLPLYDNETKGCCDGLEKQGINYNQGAESTLSFWISHLVVLSSQREKIL